MNKGMIAGRDMDAQIDVTIFGGTCARCGKQPAMVVMNGNVYCSGECEERISDYGLDDYEQRRKHYSGSIEAAWEIVIKLRLSIIQSEDGWYAIRQSDIEHHRVSCTDRNAIHLIGENGDVWLPSETMPLAVCATALKLAADGRVSRFRPQL